MVDCVFNQRVAADSRSHTPVSQFRSTRSIVYHSILLQKALTKAIARQDPQQRNSKSEFEKTYTSGRHKGHAKTPAPLFGIHIERTQFSMVWQIRFVCWSRGGKPMDQPFFDRHHRPRL